MAYYSASGISYAEEAKQFPGLFIAYPFFSKRKN